MENYEVISVIGKGNFGSISKIKRKTDNKTLVWKEMDYGNMSEKEKQQIVAEVNILRELKHPNIVRYYDRLIDKKNTKIYIIMEYCEGGDMGALVKRCKKNKEYIAEDVIWKIFTQLILALNECHSHKDGKILHRDLKLSNVFMDSENNVKLGDFGLSRVLTDSNNFAISNVGTPYYMSPEQIEELEYNEKSDIWSLGCFLYEISSLTPPFEASNHLSLANKIKLGKFDRIPSRYSEELFRIITWMLNVEPSKRPTLGDLINIPNVSLRLRERRLKDNIAKYKYLEEMHKLKENELQLKEKNLKEFENMLKERELKLEVKEKYLIEKERNLETKASKNNYQSKENIEKIFEKSESNPCKLHDLFKSESIIKRINTSGVLTTENSENSSNQKDYFFTPVMDKFTNKNSLQTPKEKNMKFIVKCDILENKEKSKSEKTLIDEIGDKSGDYESNNQLESHKNKSKITNKISTNTYQKANSQKYVKNKGELTEKIINKQKTLTNMMNDNLVKTQYK